MYQSLHERTDAEDKHICETCLNKIYCSCKPPKEQWRFVLGFCEREERLVTHL